MKARQTKIPSIGRNFGNAGWNLQHDILAPGRLWSPDDPEFSHARRLGGRVGALRHGQSPDRSRLRAVDVPGNDIRGEDRFVFNSHPCGADGGAEQAGKPDWSDEIRPPIATNLSSRAQMALNLGGLIADGYIAVEAEDAQQVKNIGKDIMTLAKPLGVQQDILNRGKSLTEFAEHGEWIALKEEFESTQNEVKKAMIENKDQDLVTLVTLGGWIRGTEVISDYLSKHYTEAGAKLLRQPAIVRFLSDKVMNLPEKMRDDQALKKVRSKLADIETSVSFPRDHPPTVEAVKTLNTLTSDLMNELAKKGGK